MNKDRIENWLRESEQGDTLMYLQADRASRRPEISERMMQAAEDGLVFLYQKKVRPGVYNHYAKRLSSSAGRALKPWKMES